MAAERFNELARRTVLSCGVAGLLAGCTNTPVRRPDRRAARQPGRPTLAPRPAPRPATLPSGARELFPWHRLIGLCGAPGAESLGQMTGDLNEAAKQLVEQAGDYRFGRAVLPVVELIATVVNPTPGADRMYRTRAGESTVADYLEQARAVGGLLLLNVQPGLADLLPEVAAYEKWLREPDVGVALDPEWAIEPGAVPGQEFGTTTGTELDGVAGYLAELVRRHDLPEKVMAYHQVAASVVTEEQGLRRYDGVAAVKSVDGIGTPELKLATWRRLMRTKPAHVQPGFKLFYTEDTEAGPLMTPAQVLGLEPEPGYVMYE